jgi:hypothetical protein
MTTSFEPLIPIGHILCRDWRLLSRCTGGSSRLTRKRDTPRLSGYGNRRRRSGQYLRSDFDGGNSGNEPKVRKQLPGKRGYLRSAL